MTSIKLPFLNRSSIVVLQTVLVVVGVLVLTFLLWEPQVEGRNVHSTLSQIYFNDPFLAYIYLASVSFFVAIYQAFKVLGFTRQNRIFSLGAVKALRTIKWCAIALIGFVVGGEVFILLHDSDDHAGGVMMGVFITVGSIITATAAATVQSILQNAVDLKSENDLTI